MLRRWGVSLAIVAALVALIAAPAAARTHHRLAVSSITLDADAGVVGAGQSVRLSGSITPAAGGVGVDILDDADVHQASTTTASDGSFSLHLVPAANVVLHASSSGTDSDPVTVDVRAVLTAHLGAVRLFDTTTATGSITPIRAGSDVDLTLLRRGGTVATRTATVGAAGGFRAGFYIHRIGRYRVRATFSAPDLVTGQASSGTRATRLPTLRTGSRSRYVLLLERRLRELHYHLTSVNRHFDLRTADAVLAFRKVQRMRRISTVTASTWRALVSPRRFGVRGPRRGFHIEVNKSLQVLATVRAGRVTAMIHVSTGAPATPTPEGTFRVNRKIAGYSPHRLYYPSYFDGNRAIHGWPDVPPYNASHGCVRVPYWTARWIFHLSKLGTKVLIYH